MDVYVILECDESFKKKAAYTFRTFFEVLGLKGRFVAGDEIPSGSLSIWYGYQQPKVSGPVIFIQADEKASVLFKNRMELDLSHPKRFQWCGEDSLALFYDETFERNSAEIATGDRTTRYVHVDIVASAFHFLSCWQEITSAERDGHDRFPASASLQQKFGLLDTPLVNQYIDIFRSELEKSLEQPLIPQSRYAGKEFAVCFTHDIDYIRKWSLGIIYRELVQYFLLGHQAGGFGNRLARLRSFLKAFSRRSDPFVSSLERIVKVEKDAGVHATYFLKSGVSSKQDVSYRINDGSVFRLLKELQADGHEIGLHPSYHTHLDGMRMRVEKARLDGALQEKSVAVRQHFLRFKAPETWRLQAQEMFKYDSTLGFADHEGLRASICHPFRPYDVAKDEAINLWEIPLIAMDGTFQSYRNKTSEEALEIIKSLVTRVKKYRGVAVLLFHNTCYDELDFPGWGRVFEELLTFAFEEGAYVGSGKEILDSYLQSLPT